MPLSNATADTLSNDVCAALGVTDADAKAKWKSIFEKLYTALKADITVTILASSIVTTGGPATQTGPAAPIPLNPG